MPRDFDPARNRCLDDLVRELRKRHDANSRRERARRWDEFGPVIPNRDWYQKVARRWLAGKDDA